jgi:endonuclease/exonuclease/phosphatase family metal-dependent hydrolase
MSISNSRRLPLLLLCISGLALAGCQTGTMLGRSGHPEGRAIVLDGRFDDWAAGRASIADEHFLYFRVTVEDHGMPLQAAPETVALWLDLDGDAATGIPVRAGGGMPEFGPDLVVEFSPAGERGRFQRGVAVYAADGAERIPLTHSQIDLISTPTHAAGAYEIRIARHVDAGVPEAVRTALTSRGQARSMFVVSGAEERINGWSDPETFSLPAAADSPHRSSVSLPAKPAGAVRVLSWNIHDRSPLNSPAPFSRIIQALQPDVILFQEMWDTDDSTILAWFTSVVTGDVAWTGRTLPGGQGGVAIIARHPMTPLGPDTITIPPAAGAGQQAREQMVRFIGATVQTPSGDLAVASIHLKCCGTAGSNEDLRRLAEARAINMELARALETSNATMRIIAGDFNLVGSRTPVDVLRADLDVGGAQLVPAEAMVLGDAAVYTWSNPASEFAPGRLDWAVASSTEAHVVNAFVLDGRRLSDRALAAMGLDRGDTAASDHLPLVIDIKPR